MSRSARFGLGLIAIVVLAAATLALLGTQISAVTTRSGGDRMREPTPFIDGPARKLPLFDLWDYPSCPPTGCPQ